MQNTNEIKEFWEGASDSKLGGGGRGGGDGGWIDIVFHLIPQSSPKPPNHMFNAYLVRLYSG